MSWSLVQGVLPTVPDQETEETQPYAPNAGASSQVWEQRGRKNIYLELKINLFPSVSNWLPITKTCFNPAWVQLTLVVNEVALEYVF
jgi:hypothetical protein